MQPQGMLTPVPSESGRHIVALGEATGHHHSFAAATGRLLRDEAGHLWAALAQEIEALPVTHQEHAPVVLRRTAEAQQLYQGDIAFLRTAATPPGLYRVVRQRVYDLASGEAREVID